MLSPTPHRPLAAVSVEHRSLSRRTRATTSSGARSEARLRTSSPSLRASPTASDTVGTAAPALITRGLAELARLGVALGGDPLTFLGLAGNGDLIATCSSPDSRNHRVGFALGQSRRLDDILAETNMVPEGVESTPAVLALARGAGVEMPVAEQVGAMLAGERSLGAAVESLWAADSHRNCTISTTRGPTRTSRHSSMTQIA